MLDMRNDADERTGTRSRFLTHRRGPGDKVTIVFALRAATFPRAEYINWLFRDLLGGSSMCETYGPYFREDELCTAPITFER